MDTELLNTTFTTNTTMTSKSIKISEENHKWLLEYAAELQKVEKRSISIDEALRNLKKKEKSVDTLLALAGSWKMSEKEVEDLKKDLRKRWKQWNKPSV